jgi:hypothetical protein
VLKALNAIQHYIFIIQLANMLNPKIMQTELFTTQQISPILKKKQPLNLFTRKKNNLTLILRDNKSKIIEVNNVNGFNTKWYFLENGLIDYHEKAYFKTKKTIRTFYKYETKLKNKK